jgi:alpha-glucosidase (family GH31 glycosyl hydrolase)
VDKRQVPALFYRIPGRIIGNHERRRKHEGALSDRNKSSLQTGERKEGGALPDPERFLTWLHDKGLHVTLNVHPADGVRDYEDAYEKMGEALRMDPGSGLPIVFDVADEKLMEAYFEYLHHPLEKEGVDFWWIDWQQGGVSRLEGMDPLWMLNHYHFLDNARDGKRPMTFSRYAGPGSHRYPVGFSGDTIVSWKSLDFQPYFTASASNIGYSMWSHDIGGHMLGERDDELAGRWVQYGVFSPVMRLHSSNSQFNSKEPWRYRQEIREVMENFLRLRHKMLPYLYTMNHRQYEQGIPAVLPMYYFYPEQRYAYQVPNQYLFGSALMVAAVTTPCIKELRMARTTVWIPEGEWYDIFTGLRYQGGRKMNLYRDITSIPVFAKTGEIIPFQEDCMEDALRNPQGLHLHVYTGQDGSFTLYEDDNITADYQSGKCVRTSLEWKEEEGSLVIRKATGDLSLIPEKRDYRITFWGIEDAKALEVRKEAGQNPAAVIKGKGRIEIEVKNVSADQESVVYLRERKYGDNRVLERCFEILDRAEIQMIQKEGALGILESGKGAGYLLGSLLSLGLNPDLYGALAEILTA